MCRAVSKKSGHKTGTNQRTYENDLQNISVRIVAVKLIYLVNNSQVTKNLIETAVKIILTNQTETKGNINIIAQRQITVQCDVTHNCS